jgi:hypothetical protein
VESLEDAGLCAEDVGLGTDDSVGIEMDGGSDTVTSDEIEVELAKTDGDVETS